MFSKVFLVIGAYFGWIANEQALILINLTILFVVQSVDTLHSVLVWRAQELAKLNAKSGKDD